MLCLGSAASFASQGLHQRRKLSFPPRGMSQDDDNDKNKFPETTSDARKQEKHMEQVPEQSLEDKMNTFLDTEFFNPEDVPEKSPLRWFADLVQNDYATAEALYASFFIAGMVLLSQELVRLQMYGDQYVPFKKLGGGVLF